jgi:hypothetical protein
MFIGEGGMIGGQRAIVIAPVVAAGEVLEIPPDVCWNQPERTGNPILKLRLFGPTSSPNGMAFLDFWPKFPTCFGGVFRGGSKNEKLQVSQDEKTGPGQILMQVKWGD